MKKFAVNAELAEAIATREQKARKHRMERKAQRAKAKAKTRAKAEANGEVFDELTDSDSSAGDLDSGEDADAQGSLLTDNRFATMFKDEVSAPRQHSICARSDKLVDLCSV